MRGPRAPIVCLIAPLALPGCMALVMAFGASIGSGGIVLVNEHWF
ncbi:hypothetical protein [Bradyrhizobium sp. ORS 111]